MAVECFGGDGVARRELVPSTAMAAPGAEAAAAAGAANGEGGAGKCEMVRRAGAGGARGDNGLLWLGTAWLLRATATRGRSPRPRGA